MPVLLLAWIALAGCHPAIRSTLSHRPTAAQLAELWYPPERNRNLYWGVGGERLAPDPSVLYRVLKVKTVGFSSGLTVEDPSGRTWSAKFPPEAPTEVVASRLLWGLGYHQPPIYYVPEWNAKGAPDGNPQLPARFRESKPNLHGLDAGKDWSYFHDPFVGTHELNGLLIFMVMVGNSDIKDQQNVIYKLKTPFEGARIWYVARDLGQSFGKTGKVDAPRGDINAFEQAPFITGVSDGIVHFDWHGIHGELISHMTPDDVRWICRRLQALTDPQWNDAFRAGGYPPELADRFIHRFKQKIQEGLAVQ
ncbi:MAG: hypothetical protein ACRD1V_08570 [Vicinamibacterales bacterium]